MGENYLNETNPELLRAIPRPGGLAKLLKDGVPKGGIPGISVAPTRASVDQSDKTSGRSGSSAKPKKKSGVTIKEKVSQQSLTQMHKGFGKLFDSAVRMSQLVIEKEDPKMSDMTKEYRVYRSLDTTPWVQEVDEILDESLKQEMPNPLQDSIDMLCICISTVMLLAIGYDVPRNHLLWAVNYLRLIKNEFDEYPPNIQGILNYIMKLHGSLTSLSDFEDPQFHSTKIEDAPPIADQAPPEEMYDTAAEGEPPAEGE